MIDDRLPVVLVILDGLGDRGCPELGGQTPCESARTPVLDQLATHGVSGLHIPFGPGRSTSSEIAHWSLFGFETIPFPGRAAIEALGVGHTPPRGVPMFHLALRAGNIRNGALWLGDRARRREDADAADQLFDALDGRNPDGIQFEFLPLRTGECVLVAHGASCRDVSDTDALFDHIHPWMRPRALSDAANPTSAARFASTLEGWLRECREILVRHPVNAAREEAGLAPLDVAVTKWASFIDPALPSFQDQVGFNGAAVTDTALYRGLARLLEMESADIAYDPTDPGTDIEIRLETAKDLLASAEFVHVHVKATDDAGHSKKPSAKKEVIEAIDVGLDRLLELSQRTIIAVTGDHATPSTGSLLHSADPTPLVIAGPGIRPDDVTQFGECHARAGTAGTLRARDVLPCLAGFANRPFFLGHRPGSRATIALPDKPEPMPLND